jgi:hypothetical protein
MADWLKILEDEIKTGNEMRKQVPKMLADPDITIEQVRTLFAALEKQAQFSEKLKAALEGLGYDFKIVDKAGVLEARYVDLAESAAERLKGMRG